MHPHSLCWLVLAALSAAQERDEIPSVMPWNFSQVVGRYRISSSAAPTELHVGEALILTVRIIGQGPEKFRPQRRNLRLFPPDIEDNFYLEALEAQDRLLPEVRQPDHGWEVD